MRVGVCERLGGGYGLGVCVYWCEATPDVTTLLKEPL